MRQAHAALTFWLWHGWSKRPSIAGVTENNKGAQNHATG
jgi:hypothetical protein